ncbi:hypothetical protein KIN20_021363 [Parelaphostrongylus tenuis]|uniref:Uncharacterized protein n=1 Tax=Parelaphostrongylus tenuis TaxID=148309 RepID=A0AAD5MNS9_PARTN|nr:hypothetical protein KIN20_021363 [Parelaphostrongylus tenuis]
MEAKCIIFGNTITATCSNMQPGCTLSNGMNVMPVPSTAMSISGTLSTTNVIMANWSRDMWQTVVNRVVRAMASGPLGLHFLTAVATVS